MPSQLEKIEQRADTLRTLADERGVKWKERAKLLPKGDGVAMLGLLADELGIPLALALDDQASKDELRKHITKETRHG